MQRLLAALSAALLVAMLVHDAGVAWWRRVPIGDATDCGLFAFYAVWFGLGYLAKARQAR